MTHKFRELVEELRDIVFGKRNVIDLILPPLVFFVLVQTVGFQYAVWGAISLAILLTGWRLARRQSVVSAAGGVVSVLIAVILIRVLDRDEGFFIPSILIGVGNTLLAAVSILAKRPMVAWSSHLARRWPRDWYWHPLVRPAYTEVTWLWFIYFLLRSIVQLNLFQGQQAVLLAGLNVIFGWPATLLLLIVSYVYGTWRLRNLSGPSVAEFLDKIDPPWESQRRGF